MTFPELEGPKWLCANRLFHELGQVTALTTDIPNRIAKVSRVLLGAGKTTPFPRARNQGACAAGQRLTAPSGGRFYNIAA